MQTSFFGDKWPFVPRGSAILCILNRAYGDSADHRSFELFPLTPLNSCRMRIYGISRASSFETDCLQKNGAKGADVKLAPQVLPGNLRRNPLVFLGFVVLFAVAAYKTAGLVIARDMTSLGLVAIAFAISALVVAILNDWRKGLYFFLTWLLFEDFARKYLGNNMAIYFAKDFLLLVVYLSFFAAYRRKEVTGFRPPFLVPVILFVWFGVIQVFNPGSTHIVYGLLGLKLFFYYVPLVFVGYALINSEIELRRFFFVNLALAAIIGGLGIAQAILGHTFLNPGNPAEEIRELSTLYRAAPISGARFYRPASVFVSTRRFGDFLLVSWLLVFGFAGYLLLRHKRGRVFTFLVTGLIAAALLLGSSRGVVMWGGGSALVGALAFAWGAPWRQREVVRLLRTLQRAVAAVALGVLLLLLLFPEALLSRMAFTPRLSLRPAAQAISGIAPGITRFAISLPRSVMSAGLMATASVPLLSALNTLPNSFMQNLLLTPWRVDSARWWWKWGLEA